jgi:hypothetical protein
MQNAGAIQLELLDEYSTAVRGLVDRFYSGVSRYTTSGFLRMKLAGTLEKRGVAPHIFHSAEEARSDIALQNGRTAAHDRGPNCQVVVAYMGAVAPEAIQATGFIAKDRRDVGQAVSQACNLSIFS